jgi:hypothetical protein
MPVTRAFGDPDVTPDNFASLSKQEADAGETAKSLDSFVANFCTPQPDHSANSQGGVRTTMDQLGVYFTLNAPFIMKL